MRNELLRLKVHLVQPMYMRNQCAYLPLFCLAAFTVHQLKAMLEERNLDDVHAHSNGC